MKNSTKLEKVKKYLDENNISYKCRRKHRNGHCDLYVIAAKVSVKIEGKDDEMFYRRHKYGYHPVFIRKNESPAFVIEKVANTIYDSLMKQQKNFIRQQHRKEALKDEERRK